MTSNTKLGTNFGCEVWPPARFSGKTSKLSVPFSHRNYTIPGVGYLVQSSFFFLLTHAGEAKEKYTTGNFANNTIFGKCNFCRKINQYEIVLNLQGEKKDNFDQGVSLAAYLTTTLKYAINSV